MQKKMLGLIAILLFVSAGLGLAQAQVSIIYSAHGRQYFTMSIPDDWRINVGNEDDSEKRSADQRMQPRLITAMPNDGTHLWFGMWVPEDVRNFKEAKKYIDSIGFELLTDVITRERKFDTLNGMPVYYAGGTGKKEGESMDFYAAFFQLSKNTVAMAIYIGPHETTVSHGDELKQMLLSLQTLEK